MTVIACPPGSVHAGRKPVLQIVRVWQQSLEPCPACEGRGLEILCEERPGHSDCELEERCPDCGYSGQAEAQQSIL